MGRLLVGSCAVIGLHCEPAGASEGRPQPASPIWIHAQQARALSLLMVPGSRVGVENAGALGDFILPSVTVMDEKPGLDSWAEFAVEIPKSGVYYVWGRFRSSTGGDSLRVVAASASTETRALIFGANDGNLWQWRWDGGKPGAGRLKLELPAGPWVFRICLNQSMGTTFRPLRWRQADLTLSPRLNALCLTTDPDYVPTDAEARRAFGAMRTPSSKLAVQSVPLPALPADGVLVENRKRVPDWMRCPRWFTKDSWREELQYRHTGDIATLVRHTAANNGAALRLSILWGGEVYYQSRVAPHVPGLGDLDYLREAMDEARRSGVKVVAYMNPNALYGDHPLFRECAVRGPDGQVSTRPAYGWKRWNSFYACINHPRYRQFLREVLTEIFTCYGPAGLYVDGLTPHVCFCEHCRTKWRTMFGSEMPVDKLAKNTRDWAVWSEFGRDPQPVGDMENDADARRWTEMFHRSLVEVTHEFSVTVKKAKPDAVTLFHSHPKAGSDDDYDGTLTEVYTPRPWVHLAWRSGELAGYSAVYHVPVLFNIYPHRHFTEAEARYHAFQGLANGAYPNFWSALGMKPVFDFMTRCADYLDFETAAPVKFLALPRDLYESDTQRKTPKADGVSYGSRDRFLAPYVGAYSALMRSGLPIVTLHRPHFEEQLSGFKVLMLANVALMSDAQIEAVRRFVRDGGGLIATHETSLYDEKGQRRQDFGLADLFGVHYRSALKAAPRAMRLKTSHALARGLAADQLPVHDEPVVVVVADGAETVAQLGELPGVLAHHFGKGRVVYLPGRLDSMQCYELSPTIERLFANAVRWAAQDAVPVEVEAVGAVGVSLFHQPRRLIIHLVNHQRDSLFKSDICESISKLTLRVHLPADCHVQRVRRLWEDRDLPFQEKGGGVTTKVGALGEYEAVAVEW